MLKMCPAPGPCPPPAPCAWGSASPEEELGGEGVVLKVLCVRRQLGAVNSAWFCSEKAQSCHWQRFSIEAKAGNRLARSAVLPGGRGRGGRGSLEHSHCIKKKIQT